MGLLIDFGIFFKSIYEFSIYLIFNFQVKEYKERQRRREIANRLKELQEKEEKLRFFERRNQIKVAQSRAPREISIEEFVEQEVFVAPPGERGRKNEVRPFGWKQEEGMRRIEKTGRGKV